LSTESRSPLTTRRSRQRAQKSPKRRPMRVGRPKLDVASPDAEARICEVSLDLFAERGFSSVTTKDIADATGFNPALIYYYFGSKEELFRRAVTLAVEGAFEQFRIAREGLKHPRDIIYGWLDNHIKEYETISKLINISIDYAKTSKRNVRIDEAIRRFYVDERDVLRTALAEGIARGDFRSVDVDETASFISTYLDGVFARAMILKDFDPIASIGELRSFLNTHLKRKK
jgi:TetR/AcrR family transcriptional regulator, upper aerobic nicotinate degradation pathway regulator